MDRLKNIKLETKHKVLLIIALLVVLGVLGYTAYKQTGIYREKAYQKEEKEIVDLKEKYNIQERDFVPRVNVEGRK